MRREPARPQEAPGEIRILLVGVGPEEAGALRALFDRSGSTRFVIEECPTAPAAVERLGRGAIDALILSLSRGNPGGLGIFDQVQRLFPRIPIVVLAADQDESAADQAFRHGAQDYLQKGQFDGPTLFRAIRYAIERKKWENALRKSEERFELMARATNDAVWDVDLTTSQMWWNVGARSHLGYPPDIVVSDIGWWRERLHPEDRERVLRRLGEVMTGGGQFWMDEYRFRCADGSYAHVFDRGYILREGEEKPVRMIGAMMDVTPRRRAEEALREANETLRTLIQASPVGIMVIDVREKIRAWNPAAERIFGWYAHEVLGRPLVPLAPPGGIDEFTALARQALAGEAVAGREFPSGRKAGGQIEISVSMAPLRDALDRISGAMAVILDVTPRKAAERQRTQLEERLWQSQKMEAVGRLAGGVAHDFNNLLTAVSGYAELIQSRFESPDPVRTYADEIRASSDRAAQLTRQLLAFGRRQVLQVRVLDLNDVVQGMAGLLRRLIGEHIDLGTSLDPNLGAVRADRAQIEQVIMNLAVNARDVMPGGGKLTIETRNVELDGSYFERHGRPRTGSHVLLAVSDTGSGMNAETQSHVFEPFFTTKEQDKGTGLGLATVYGIVKQSEGDIWVYSEENRGASFKIYLPRVEEAPTPVREAAPVPRRRGNETVLLAEDSDAVRRLLRELLRKDGYTVLEARNGLEAEELASNTPAPIHLLITDMVMPRMSGRELAARLAPKRPDMKVLFMSGYTEEASIRQGILAPGTAFLEKPFTPASVVAKVRELLDEKGA